jgi:hypothetical protein
MGERPGKNTKLRRSPKNVPKNVARVESSESEADHNRIFVGSIAPILKHTSNSCLPSTPTAHPKEYDESAGRFGTRYGFFGFHTVVLISGNIC